MLYCSTDHYKLSLFDKLQSSLPYFWFCFQGSGNGIGIKFDGDEINVSERAFEGMSNLQFLRLGPEIDNGGDAFHLFGGQSYLSRKLRLLNWSYFPLTCLHCIPKPELLVELIMPDSKLERLWERTKVSNIRISFFFLTKLLSLLLIRFVT